MLTKLDQGNQEILITKFLAGEASPDEIHVLQKWLDDSNENLLYFHQLKNIWDNSDLNVDLKTLDTDKALKMVKKRVNFNSPRSNFWQYWKNIAAIILFPLILGNLLYFSHRQKNYSPHQEPIYNELFAAFGTRCKLMLSDGTSVYLNSGSSIKYPEKFTGNKRNVFLKGEAYFDVERDPQKPFIVETSSVTVKALGTKFNVSEYAASDKVEVTLVTGKVEVSMTDEKSNISASKLEINQHFLFNKVNKTISINNEDSYKYIAWKDGKLIFRNEPLREVANKISQVFNIDIEIKGSEIQNYNLRATFQDESLSEILRLLKISSPIDYIELNRDPLPDGSFSRKKVIIFPVKQK